MCFLDLPVPAVTVVSEGESTAGENYTLTCTVSVIENLAPHASVALTWTDRRGDYIQPSYVETSGANTTSTLDFSPLLLSHSGRYICNASITIPDIATVKRNAQSYNITTQSKPLYLQHS